MVFINPAKSQDNRLIPNKFVASNETRLFENTATAYDLPISREHKGADNYECSQSIYTKGADRTSEDSSTASDVRELAYEITPSIKISSIGAVSVEGSVAYIGITELGYHKEYSAQVFNTTRKTHFEARPGTAILAQTFTLGLSLIFAPKMSALQIIGCNDYQLVKRSLNLQTKKFTGRYLEKQSFSSQELVLAGIGDKPIEISLSEDYIDNKSRVLKYDFSEIIKKIKIDGPITLKVNCRTCSNLSKSEIDEIGALGSATTIEVDFTPIKRNYDEVERLIALRQKAAEDEAVRLKIEKEKQQVIEQERQKKEKQLELQRRQQQQKKEQIFKI